MVDDDKVENKQNVDTPNNQDIKEQTDNNPQNTVNTDVKKEEKINPYMQPNTSKDSNTNNITKNESSVEDNKQIQQSNKPIENKSVESKEDELEKLKKENERLKEIQRLKEENSKFSNDSQSSSSKNTKKENKILVPAIVGAVFVAVILIVLIFGLRIFSGVSTSSVSPLNASVNANASGAFFLGPDGESLGSTYIEGLSNLSSQLAEVGAEQVKGTTEYEPATTSSGELSPSYYVLVYGNSSGDNYDIIPIPVPSNFSSNHSISENGKPTFVYIGAQGCPYCAGMRWAVAIALSRFGNFSELFYDRSATNDANVPTLMFNFSESIFKIATSQSSIGGEAPYGDEYPTPIMAGAYYTSKYINFEPLDEMGGSYLINTTGIADISPMIYSNVYLASMHGVNETSNGGVSAADGFGIHNFFMGGVPFFDINNQYVFDGANINARTYLTSSGLNQSYSTHAEVLNSIENPTAGSLGQTELGAANILTAQICSTINNTAPVCSLSYISELESEINALNYSN